MNATPRGDTPMSRRGGVSPLQACATTPSTAEPPPALQRAGDLAAILDNVYGIEADVHELRSGNAIVSVFLGLLAYTDGETFWWTSPELSNSGSPLLSSELTLSLAAEQLAEHYAILRARPATGVLEVSCRCWPTPSCPTMPTMLSRADRKELAMFPGTPVSGRLSAAVLRRGAVAALQRLRVELHNHRIYPEIAYDEGEPRLLIGTGLTVWADRKGAFFAWGAVHMEEPAEHAPADDLPQVARRIAERLGQHYTEPDSPQ